MNETVTIEVTTQVFGMGGGKAAAPAFLELAERTISVRSLIAEHVRAELARVEQRRTSSLALHYMLATDVREELAAVSNTVDVHGEIQRAWDGLAQRRYVLVVDGHSIDELEMDVCLTERSLVTFVRLLPLVGG